MPYTPHSTKTGAHAKYQTTNFMKTNKRNVIIAAIITSTITLIATTKISASYFDLLAIGVSYTAVAILVALTVVDYRGNMKDYAGR